MTGWRPQQKDKQVRKGRGGQGGGQRRARGARGPERARGSQAGGVRGQEGRPTPFFGGAQMISAIQDQGLGV